MTPVEKEMQMDKNFLLVMMEATMKAALLADTSIVILVETPTGKSWAGCKRLKDDFVNNRLFLDADDNEYVLNHSGETFLRQPSVTEQERNHQLYLEEEKRTKERLSNKLVPGVKRKSVELEHVPALVVDPFHLATVQGVRKVKYKPKRRCQTEDNMIFTAEHNEFNQAIGEHEGMRRRVKIPQPIPLAPVEVKTEAAEEGELTQQDFSAGQASLRPSSAPLKSANSMSYSSTSQQQRPASTPSSQLPAQPNNDSSVPVSLVVNSNRPSQSSTPAASSISSDSTCENIDDLLTNETQSEIGTEGRQTPMPIQQGGISEAMVNRFQAAKALDLSEVFDATSKTRRTVSSLVYEYCNSWAKECPYEGHKGAEVNGFFAEKFDVWFDKLDASGEAGRPVRSMIRAMAMKSFGSLRSRLCKKIGENE